MVSVPPLRIFTADTTMVLIFFIVYSQRSTVYSLQSPSGFGLRLWSMDVAHGTHGYHGISLIMVASTVGRFFFVDVLVVW